MAEGSERTYSEEVRPLTDDEVQRLDQQNSRLVSDFKANSLELHAKKHWDLFYKRNETRFFKDRHWSTREFSELMDNSEDSDGERVLLEVGCGVGNFIFPLILEKLKLRIFACDLSPRAIKILKSNALISNGVSAFVCDITTSEVFYHMDKIQVDIITMIFVLSAIHPNKFETTLTNLHTLLKPGGLLLFRDYGLHDMAQIRFSPGSKISENFYVRQDGTRSYYFSTEYAQKLFEKVGFKILLNKYVYRRTINKKKDIDVPRIYIQVKAKKPF